MNNNEKVRMRLGILKSIDEAAKVNLKKGGFIVADVVYIWTFDTGKSIDTRVYLKTDNINLEFDTNRGIVSRSEFSFSIKNISSVEKYSAVGGEKHSDLTKIQKQCSWPTDLERKRSKAGNSKFIKIIKSEQPSKLHFEELILKGYTDCFELFDPIINELDLDRATLAVKHNRFELLKWFLEKKQFQLEENHKAELLTLACKNGDSEIIKYLVSNGFDVNNSYKVELSSGRLHEVYPINNLVSGVHTEILSWIVEQQKAVIKTPEHFRSCCMEYHAEFSFDTLIKIIPETNNQAFLNNGLEAAAFTYMPEVLTKLLEMGADANYRSVPHVTMVSDAIKKGNSTIINELLKYGLDATRTEVEGKSALELAVESGREDIVLLLKEAAEKQQ